MLDIERIIWADFLQGREADPRVYAPVTDIGLFIGKMDAFQDEYNSDISSSKKSMKLVMFLDACEHIARIARVLR